MSTSLSTSQLRALRSLERKEGINLRALGDVLGSAPSSVSRLCHRLESLGFVERTRSSVSRRELELRLTDRGRRCLAELRARREGVLMAAIEAMAPASRIALLEGLDGFRRAVATTGADQPRGDAPTRSA
ncbi:MarR family winged helix-turn-helix transcriptional regulator [Streptomyces sp. NPDC059176]|uniref:MarR family winged helix-turn-helix transcriptional regulator n=1 Tax=Streptomyces sp. NPDC059176 TaxID=3346758 RepID=UPI00368844B3